MRLFQRHKPSTGFVLTGFVDHRDIPEETVYRWRVCSWKAKKLRYTFVSPTV